MKITSVTYRRLQSLPGFSNQAVEATAELEPNETPDIAIERLKAWVHCQLDKGGKDANRLADVQGEVWMKEQELAGLQSEVDALTVRKETLQSFYRMLLDEEHTEQLPF